VVAIRRFEHHCMPRELTCPPEAGGQSAAKTRSIDCFEIAAFQDTPGNACGCPPPPKRSTAAPSVAGAAGGAAPEGATSDRKPLEARVVAPVFRLARTAGDGADFPQCYVGDITGKCNCDCCSSEWVVIAALARPAATSTNTGTTGTGSQLDMITWTVDYSVSRFIRPVLLGEIGQERG
jgi:hypothetical protein